MERTPSRHLVLDTGLRGAEIRPPAILTEFSALCRREAPAFFPHASLVEVPCPGCASSDHRVAAVKDGFRFGECAACGSFYVSPRPTAEAIDRFRRESDAYRHKIGRLVPAGAQARRFHLIASLAQWVGRLAGPGVGTAADWRPISPLVVSEILADRRFAEVVAFAPHPLAAEACRAAGARVVGDGEPLGGVGAIVLTEILDQVFSPEEELRRVRAALPDGGLVVLTARNASGFDLSVLGPRAPYVYVPEHLNLLSERGLAALLARTGFELVECSTPGQLDVQFVAETVAADPAVDVPSFVRMLVTERDGPAHEDFQQFLQKHRLSSHLRAAARALPRRPC